MQMIKKALVVKAIETFESAVEEAVVTLNILSLTGKESFPDDIKRSLSYYSGWIGSGKHLTGNFRYKAAKLCTSYWKQVASNRDFVIKYKCVEESDDAMDYIWSDPSI